MESAYESGINLGTVVFDHSFGMDTPAAFEISRPACCPQRIPDGARCFAWLRRLGGGLKGAKRTAELKKRLSD